MMKTQAVKKKWCFSRRSRTTRAKHSNSGSLSLPRWGSNRQVMKHAPRSL